MSLDLRRGDLIAAGSAVALFVCMLLPWYGTKHEVTETGFALPARDVTINAFRSFGFIDILLVIAILVAIGAALISLFRDDLNLHAALSVLVTAFGALATVLVAYRIAVPIENVEREFGLFLALLPAAGITAGGVVWMSEEGSTVGAAREELSEALAGRGGSQKS